MGGSVGAALSAGSDSRGATFLPSLVMQFFYPPFAKRTIEWSGWFGSHGESSNDGTGQVRSELAFDALSNSRQE